MPCSSVIQKITQSTLSWRMICLVKMVLSAKQTAATSAAAWPGPKGERAGLGDDEDAEKAEERPGDAGAGQPLAEEEGGEQRHPDRVGELERHELAERDQHHREEPEVLAGIVEEVALEVQPAGARCGPGRSRARCARG